MSGISGNALGGIAVIVAIMSSLFVTFSNQAELNDLRNDIGALRDGLENLESRTSPVEASPQEGEHGEEEQMEATVEFTLQTTFGEGGLAFVGAGGEIAGKNNPMLQVNRGDIVKITIVNNDGIEHDFQIAELGVHAQHVRTIGEETSVTFKAEREGEFSYICSIPGHKEAGMEGKLVVLEAGAEHTSTQATSTLDIKHIAKDPTQIPPPIARTQPTTVKITLIAQELTAEIADGTS
ncbi:MAG: cupredoxin domain-containing protein, partial [Thaumarchaeota archaeon]|nr:cupredoxin domain-containing protein [Nitrososphaerota archaeon]